MIVGGSLLIPGSDGRARLIPGWLRVGDDGRIAARGEAGPDAPALDLGGDADAWVVAPGFVDAHWHPPQFRILAAEGMTLLDWLETVVFPAEAAWSDPGFAARDAEAAIGRLLDRGTTAFAAYATVHHEGTRAAIEVAESLGTRAAIGQVVMDAHAPPELLRPTRIQIEETEALVRERRGRRVEAAVTPRFAPCCTGEALAGLGAIARATGALVQTHLAETREECRIALERHDAESYTAIYARAGLLDGRAALGHGVWLSDDERTILRDGPGAFVAHCPTANWFLRSGTMDLAGHRAAGVRVGLGSDVGAGFEPSMPRVAVAALNAARGRGDAPPDSATAWHMITRGNAEALGFDDVGRLEVGASADLLVCRVDFSIAEARDPLARLLHAWDDRWLRRVLVRGRVARAFDPGSGASPPS